MKKPFLRISMMMLLFSLMTGCHKDSVDPNKAEFPTTYSDLTVEQNKQNLEDNGISLVNSLTDIKNTSGIQTMIAFSHHLDGSTLPENLGGRDKTSSDLRLIHLLASLGEGKSSITKTLKGMRTSDDEFTSFQEEYEKAIGVYTYSKANDEWTYEETGDKIVFLFPSTEDGTENNAEYDVYGYKGVTITSSLGGDDYTGDYPTALKADLLVNGVKKMSYVFAASYNSKGDPSSLLVSYSIDSYTFKFEISNSTSEAKVDYTLTESNNILLAFGLSASGNFSTDDVEESEGPEDVFTKGTAYFQIENIKFSGLINYTALADALDEASTDEETAQAWNDNYKLIVFYADSKEKIADSEFYVVEETQESDAYVDVRMIFADDTKSDLSTYTDVGFDDLSDKFHDFIDDLDND